MLKALKIRLYPNKTQATQINKLLGCYRFIYNQCLAKKINSYKENEKSENLTTLGYFFHNEIHIESLCNFSHFFSEIWGYFHSFSPYGIVFALIISLISFSINSLASVLNGI